MQKATGILVWVLGSALALGNGSAWAAAPDNSASPPPAQSDPGSAANPGKASFLHWHNDISRFNEQDYLVWNSGRWVHGKHEGEDGWWWVVNDTWYYYSSPTYPFPDPYAPDGVVASKPSLDTPANNPPDSDTPPPRPAFWYFCDKPSGYYPYVASCEGDWQPVLPTPPQPTKT